MAPGISLVYHKDMANQQQIQVLKKEHYRKMPWKNGKGLTHQIAIGPDLANFESLEFSWRLSTAPIETSGPFSLFPGFKRLFAIIEGGPIKLQSNQSTTTLSPFHWHQFSGDDSTYAELLQGPIIDLNFFWRDEDYQVNSEYIELHQGDKMNWTSKGELNFLFLAKGQLNTEHGIIYPLDTYQIFGSKGINVELESLMPSHLLSISLEKHR